MYLPLHVFTTALVVSAVVVCATPGLTVKTSTPNTEIDGLENLRVTTSITNTGDETLKLLNDPRGVLSSFPENSFIIIDPVGSRPSFNGAKVKFSPAYAAGLNNPGVFTVLAPGASIDVAHDLSTAYNFTRSGAGDYTIEPSNLFTYVDADSILKDLYATVEGVAEVTLSGNLAVPRSRDKRASFTGCSPENQSDLDIAASNAQKYATVAFEYLKPIWGLTGPPRYTTWFGTYTPHRKDIAQYHFGKIRNNQFSSFTYHCTCTDPSIFSYVLPFQFGTIYLCGAFWNAPSFGTDSKAGTFIQASSQFTANGGTTNYVFGQTAAKNLAISNAPEAVLSADNHEYFAENTPALP